MRSITVQSTRLGTHHPATDRTSTAAGLSRSTRLSSLVQFNVLCKVKILLHLELNVI